MNRLHDIDYEIQITKAVNASIESSKRLTEALTDLNNLRNLLKNASLEGWESATGKRVSSYIEKLQSGEIVVW